MKKIERCTGFTERSIHFTVFTVYASAACYKNKIMTGSQFTSMKADDLTQLPSYTITCNSIAEFGRNSESYPTVRKTGLLTVEYKIWRYRAFSFCVEPTKIAVLF